MNDNLTFWQLYDKVVNKLDERHLGEAIELLQNIADTLGDWQLLDEVSNISSAYGLLLHYMEQGIDDPARDKQHTNFIANCYCIADKAAQAERRRQNNALQKTRPIEDILKDLENIGLKNITSELGLEEKNRHVELYTELFNCSYNAPLWNEESAATSQQIIDSALISENDKALFISGLFIGTLQTFDSRKLLFFIDNYSTTTNDFLRVRLLVAIGLVLYTFNRRLFAFPAIADKVKHLYGNTRFCTDMQTLQLLTIESLSTHEVDRKMREEIIPAMLKNGNFNPAKFGIDSLEEISEQNPEWKNIEQQVGKLAELEAGGADIYYSTFSALKRYSFFNNAANWLYPFDKNHPSIPEHMRKAGTKGIAAALLKSETLCDSDKYSFCMLTTQMTEEQIRMIVSQLPEIGEQNIPTVRTSESIYRNYLRDLFRFFYLFNGKSKPANPFEKEISLLDCNILSDIFNDYAGINRISAFALKKEKYDMAVSYLLLNEKSGNTDAETYQKLGFCYQKKKMYFDAIAAYEKAYALKGDSRWTIQHLAQTNRIVGNYKEALNYYKLLDSTNDEDAKTAFRCGECLVHMERYDEAIKEFYKAEYLNPSLIAATRAIAWCSVLTDDIYVARKYYNKILLHGEQGDDLINAGHAAWIDKDIKSAITYYVNAYRQLKSSDFQKKFHADIEVLNTHGITGNDIMLMIDLISRKAK